MNKTIKKTIFISISISIIILFALSTFAYINYKHSKIETNVYKEINTIDSKQMPLSQVMTIEQQKEDIDYIVNTLKEVHPSTYNGFSNEQQKIISDMYDEIKKPMTVEDFYFVANKLFCSINDAHTKIMYSDDVNKILNLPIKWLNEGIVVSKDTDILKKGDKVISLGGLTEKDLLNELKTLIPHENDYWIKYYASYKLIIKGYLKNLGILRDNIVELKIERNGSKLLFKIPFIDYANIKKENIKEENWVRYTIDKDNSLGIFILDKCNASNEYLQALKSFFIEVKENNIENIAVDLRKNSGGYGSIIPFFMYYINIDSYNYFTNQMRISEQLKEKYSIVLNITNSELGIVKHENAEHDNRSISDNLYLYDKNIYVLTSARTFSAANMLAVVIKDNNIGTIIGEPTGNQPTGYTDILIFKLPQTGLEFCVSFKKVFRPDQEKNSENALMPDILVYTTRDDIINDRDAQIEWLKDNISMRK